MGLRLACERQPILHNCIVPKDCSRVLVLSARAPLAIRVPSRYSDTTDIFLVITTICQYPSLKVGLDSGSHTAAPLAPVNMYACSLPSTNLRSKIAGDFSVPYVAKMQ